jgi:hypothetical protein
MKKIVGSGSIGVRYGSADPDPHQNITDPQHWFFIHFTVLVHRTAVLTAPPPYRTVRGPQRPGVGEHRTQGARRQRFPETKSTAQQDSVSFCR